MIESVEQEVRRYGKENIMFSIVCPMFVNTNMLQEKEDRILISSRCSKAIYCLCHYYLNNDVHCMFFGQLLALTQNRIPYILTLSIVCLYYIFPLQKMLFHKSDCIVVLGALTL